MTGFLDLLISMTLNDHEFF